MKNISRKKEKTSSEIIHEAWLRIEKETKDLSADELKRKRFEHFCSMPGEFEFKKISRFSDKK